MTGMPRPWDYLIVTASNAQQAQAYEMQLALRQRLDLLVDVGQWMVVADPMGKRVGSGGSTIFCLLQVLNHELTRSLTVAAQTSLPDGRGSEALPRGRGSEALPHGRGSEALPHGRGSEALPHGRGSEEILRRLRILIIHAGGDSRRLPAYGPCGKIFIPLPGESDSAAGNALFDRVLKTLREMPASSPGRGQVLVASGDALITFDSAEVELDHDGLVALACHATPEAASKHGVFSADDAGRGRFFVQKPSPADQQRLGIINRYGQSALDIGVMSFDAATAMAMLRACEVARDTSGKLAWSAPMEELILSRGMDIYVEVCCALGTEASVEHYRASTRAAGSKWDDDSLARAYAQLHPVPFHVQVLPHCGFLHFGTSRQLITSGMDLLQQDTGVVSAAACLTVNSDTDGGPIAGNSAWVEGSRVHAPLTLAGQNLVIGADIERPLSLPAGACLDVLAGRGRDGTRGWFIRCYGISDTFKDTIEKGATFCGIPLPKWLAAVGAKAEDVWDAAIAPDKRSLWDARVFVLETRPDGYRDWLWMYNPAEATAAQKRAFLSAQRYSVAEMALLADQDDFHERRGRLRSTDIRRSLRRLFRRDSQFSAEDLAFALAHASDPGAWVAELLAEARWHLGDNASAGMEAFVFARVMHSLGSALLQRAGESSETLAQALPTLLQTLDAPTRAWLDAIGLPVQPDTPLAQWAQAACDAAFTGVNRAILHSSMHRAEHPRNALRADETVWGRAPARLELGGGWTDTPPYTLEYGGSVINTAVNLNGQPPIHCYGRVIDEPVIRLSSIDVGLHVQVDTIEQLMDYRNPSDPFGLVKAALAISGFATDMADWPAGTTLRRMLEEFGGGIELTTLVGIPKGSGLGTSSIIGATIIGVLGRMLGRPLDQRELFHQVLRLEQALTTGGGWQDQIGGGVGGSKITYTQPGLFPDPRICYAPDDLLDPSANGGSTLLYYTGLTRLAKNILQQVVGGFLNRNRSIMNSLAHEHLVARCVYEAMSRKDAPAFGHYINEAWRLQQQLCSDVTNEHIESLMSRVRPHIWGARILGAGSGGFLIMICRSPDHAAQIKRMLVEEPLNAKSRFFDYSINRAGLEVTTC